MLGIYFIKEGTVGILEILGRFHRVNPGLNWTYPFINRISRITNSLSFNGITKDRVTCHVNSNYVYQIPRDNAKDFYYDLTNHHLFMDGKIESYVRGEIALMTLSELTGDTTQIKTKVMAESNQEFGKFAINFLNMSIQNILPDKYVQEAMNAVVREQKNKEAAIEKASDEAQAHH